MERDDITPGPLIRLILRFIRNIGGATLIIWFILLLVFGIIIAGLSSHVKNLGVEPLIYTSLAGLLLGWIFARSSIRCAWAYSIGFLVGIALSSLAAWALLQQSFYLLWTLYKTVFVNILPSSGSQITHSSAISAYTLNNLFTSYSSFVRQTYTWLSNLLIGDSIYNSHASNFTWCLVVWTSSFFAAWVIRRMNRPLLGITPIGIIFCTLLALTGGKLSWLIPFLAATLLLIAVKNSERRENAWKRSSFDYPENLQVEISLYAAGVIFVIVWLAWGGANLSLKKILTYLRRPLQSYSIDDEAIIDSLQLDPQDQGDLDALSANRGQLPRSHLIGNETELSQQVVMLIQVDDLLNRTAIEDIDSLAHRYYWRSVTYDDYTGFGWKTSAVESISFRAHKEVERNLGQHHRFVEQHIQPLDEKIEYMFSFGELLTADKDFTIFKRIDSNGELDVFGINSKDALTPGTGYHVTSLAPTITENQLRSIPDDYPDWVNDRYLQLPDTIPERTLALSGDITEGYENPYDSAQAIENYLRGNPYTLDIPPPPIDRDVVDYFLFDLQKGYCDYYASAMVVLARAAGIPARVAIGYAGGVYDIDNKQYLLTEADAHSWVEVYFPGVGWIIFEPTASLPTVERPSIEFHPKQLESSTTDPGTDIRLIPLDGRLFYLTGIILVIIIFWLVIFYSDLWRLARMHPHKSIQTIYARMHNTLHSLSIQTSPADTPYDIASVLSNNIKNRTQNNQLRIFLSGAEFLINSITNSYTKSIYSQYGMHRSEQKSMVKYWKKLRWKLFLARLVKIKSSESSN